MTWRRVPEGKGELAENGDGDEEEDMEGSPAVNHMIRFVISNRTFGNKVACCDVAGWVDLGAAGSIRGFVIESRGNTAG